MRAGGEDIRDDQQADGKEDVGGQRSDELRGKSVVPVRPLYVNYGHQEWGACAQDQGREDEVKCGHAVDQEAGAQLDCGTYYQAR